MAKLPIIAGMATIPGREQACKEAVESLLGQVDQLHVWANGEGKWVNELHKKISKYCLTWNGKDLGDSGKFFAFHSENVGKEGNPFIYLSVDDDLIYPENYVRTFVDAITNNPKAIYSHHGRTVLGRVKSYYAIGAKYPCLHDVRSRVAVNCVGTGVCGFRSDLVNITQDDFPLHFKNMADIHLAVYAQKNKIPMYVLPHRKGWIRHSPHVKGEDTIWFKHHKSDHLQTMRINSWNNWKVYG